MTELRKRLAKAGAELHVVKNSIFRIAAKEAGVGELNGALTGQLAVITGQKDVSSAAKVIKTFAAEFDKPKLKFGYLNNKRLEANDLKTLADLPPPTEVPKGKPDEWGFLRPDDLAQGVLGSKPSAEAFATIPATATEPK